MATPISTLVFGPIQSLSTAYFRKNATPRKIASTPIRLNQFPPMRDSRSPLRIDLLAGAVGVAGGACPLACVCALRGRAVCAGRSGTVAPDCCLDGLDSVTALILSDGLSDGSLVAIGSARRQDQ